MRPSCKLAAVILATGKGKRMRSDLPKVLHEVGGRPMIHWVVAAARALFATLPLVKNNNKQNEHYLPDVLYIPGEQNQIVAIEKVNDYREILGVNTKEEWRRVHAKVSN